MVSLSNHACRIPNLDTDSNIFQYAENYFAPAPTKKCSFSPNNILKVVRLP
jgi:hypothetical protein